ncbi:hypothetical protein M3629_06205 [Paenibacillus polysaccharolyticus]|uniref:hypothetical protein n=1 Tax=Paenibacillus polysaccharolyticus TaxID=582692 RepID=UPI00203B84CC|nr:hypothetical protein [Paenibacillus polysaccharolyticus]MCM3132369.1 hypothetical protein [Paenibacillus polysaccharolyticus]
MENRNSKDYVNKLHFIYIIVCLTLVILGILAMTIWDKEEAGIGLNNAATASSIVLAVVAIVMTIVDIAGQRSTISDLRDTAETLESNLNQTNDNLRTLSELQDQLLKTMKSISKSQEDLKDNISKIEKAYENEETINPQKLNSDLKSLKEKVSFILPNNRISDYANINYLSEVTELSERILFFLRYGNEHSIAELMNQPLIKILGVTRAKLKDELTRLVRQGKVYNNNGKYSLM